MRSPLTAAPSLSCITDDEMRELMLNASGMLAAVLALRNRDPNKYQRFIQDYALEKIAADHTVRSVEPLVKRECIGVRVRAARDRACSVAAKDGITREQRFEHCASLHVSRCAGFGNGIEHDERAPSEIVAAFDSLAISPHNAAWGECRESSKRARFGNFLTVISSVTLNPNRK